MNHWPFIAGAYAFCIIAATVLVLWSLVAMRRAEAEADLAGRSQ